MRARQSNWKLFPEDVERIREAMLFGARNVDMQRIYGVSASSINAAQNGRTFAPERPPLFAQLQRFCLQRLA